MARKKKVEIELTFEEEQEQAVKRDLEGLSKDYAYIPVPTYKYNIGDKVNVGNLEECTIEEIYEGGKFYKIDYTSINNNYGNPIVTKHCKGVWMWTQIRKLNDNKNSFIKNDDINIYYSQRSINSILHQVYHFGLELDPVYQRGLVWTLEDKIKLIDSIFNNIDIGKFTFIKADYSSLDKNEVLDGKQRISALLEYYEDRFEYNGCKFSDLSIKDQNHFTGYSISWGESENLTEEQKLRYFLKLNTAGKPMDEKHLEKVRHILEELK